MGLPEGRGNTNFDTERYLMEQRAEIEARRSHRDKKQITEAEIELPVISKRTTSSKTRNEGYRWQPEMPGSPYENARNPEEILSRKQEKQARRIR